MTTALQEQTRVQRADTGEIDLPPGTLGRRYRILVVDDHELVQTGLRAMLGDEYWVANCLSASSAEIAIQVARRTMPHIIILATSVGGRPGLEVCRELRGRMPHVRVVLMSSEGRIPTSLAQSCGAVGFIPKGLPAAAIVSAVRQVAEGKRAFPKADAIADNVALSQREREVLQLLVTGLSNPEVAALLHLSRHTVKQHTSTVYRKLNVRNRAQAASRAQELGLVA